MVPAISRSSRRCRACPPARSTARRCSAVDARRRRARRASRRSRATRPRRRCSPPPSACFGSQAHAVRRRFLHRSRRPFAARRALRLRRARDAGARRDHAAGRLRHAHPARDRPTLIERTGGAGAARPRATLLHAAAAAAPLPVRPRAGGGAAVHPRRSTTAQWLGIFVTYMLLAGERLGFFGEMATLLGVYVAHQRRHGAASRSRAKWLIIGRTKPGRYPLWGVYYFRWWLVQRLQPLDAHQVAAGLAADAASTCALWAPRSATTRSSPTSRPARSTSSRSATAPRIGAQGRRSPTPRSIGNELVIGRDRHRRRRLYRHLLRASAHDVVDRRRAPSSRDLTAIPAGTRRRRRRDLGRFARPQGRRGRPRRAADAGRRLAARGARPAAFFYVARCCSSSRRSACCRSSRPSTSSTSIDDWLAEPHSSVSYLWLRCRCWPGRRRSCMVVVTVGAHRRACAGSCCRA